MAPTVSVIIPAFNEEALLPRTLARLAEALEGIDAEVIVVDNNSSDATAAVAERAGARVVFEPVNQISRARNAGGGAASGRYFFFLDADTEPTRDLFQSALARLEAGGAGGGAFIELEGAGRASFAHRLLPYFSKLLAGLGLCGGSFIYCRSDAFRDVGGFSEAVYAAEDVLFSRALRGWGKRQGRRFEVITDVPIRSSDRKLHWHSPLKLFFMLAFFAAFPFAIRFKALCRLWYARPAAH